MFIIDPPYRVTFQAFDFEFSIEFHTFYPPILHWWGDGHVWGDVNLTVHPERGCPRPILEPSILTCTPSFPGEIVGLADYFDRHIDLLGNNPDHISEEYMDREDTIKVQALHKHAGWEGMGLRIMVPQTLERSVWAGIDGETSLKKCRAFADDLRTFVKIMYMSWFKKQFPGKTPSDLDEEMRRKPGSRKFFTWLAARCSPDDYVAMRGWRKAALADRSDPPPLPDISPYIDEAEFLGQGVLPELTFTEKQ